MERWAALRYNTWRVDVITKGAGGTPTFTLPAEVDDVFQVNVNSSPNDPNASSESPMRRIGPEEYAQITTKLTKGQPSQYFLNRSSPPRLSIYPVGRANVTEYLHIWYIARPARFDGYENGVDAPGRWLEALVTGVALELAKKRPMEGGGYNETLIARLKTEADEANVIAQNADRQRTNYRFRRAGGRRH